ncbi:MAG: hypothetical protein AABX53_01515 [Nanoarchaeota archaeon]
MLDKRKLLSRRNFKIVVLAVISIALIVWLLNTSRVNLSPQSSEEANEISAEICECSTNLLCTNARKIIEQQCTDLTSVCGASCNEGLLAGATCVERKEAYLEERAWYENNCLESGCGLPLTPCCEDSLIGRCCIEYNDGTKECEDALSYSACQTIMQTPYEDKDVVVVKWEDTKVCADGECEAITGACCTINSCTPDNPYTCYDDLTFQQCEAKEAENPLCVRAQWGFEKKCTDMSCASEGCRVDFPEAYIGRSCQECYRNFCSLYEIMNGGCSAWCSSYDIPDDFGNYCCGPA